MKRKLTISVFTEDKFGMLNRITIIFTRRSLNIESITVSASQIEGVHRYTIVLTATKEQSVKVVAQIEKLVDVMKAFVHEEEEIVHQEMALYKLKTHLINNELIEYIIRTYHARILTFDSEFIVIEKTGHVEETISLFEKLKPFGILEFARSGRVAITKPMKPLTMHLQELNMLN